MSDGILERNTRYNSTILHGFEKAQAVDTIQARYGKVRYLLPTFRQAGIVESGVKLTESGKGITRPYLITSTAPAGKYLKSVRVAYPHCHSDMGVGWLIPCLEQ